MQMSLFGFVGHSEEKQNEIVQWFSAILSNEINVETVEFAVVSLVPTLNEPIVGENFTSFHIERCLFSTKKSTNFDDFLELTRYFSPKLANETTCVT